MQCKRPQFHPWLHVASLGYLVYQNMSLCDVSGYLGAKFSMYVYGCVYTQLCTRVHCTHTLSNVWEHVTDHLDPQLRFKMKNSVSSKTRISWPARMHTIF